MAIYTFILFTFDVLVKYIGTGEFEFILYFRCPRVSTRIAGIIVCITSSVFTEISKSSTIFKDKLKLSPGTAVNLSLLYNISTILFSCMSVEAITI